MLYIIKDDLEPEILLDVVEADHADRTLDFTDALKKMRQEFIDASKIEELSDIENSYEALRPMGWAIKSVLNFEIIRI